MKKILGLLALAGAMTLAGCNTEEPNLPGDLGGDAQAYINVKVSMAGLSTRADNTDNLDRNQDFAYGTDEENAVKSLILGFYGETGACLELVTVPVTGGTSHATGENVAVDEPVMVGVSDNTAKSATDLVAFVNVSFNDLVKDGTANKTLAEIQSTTLASYNPSNGFAMTNSGYYGTGYVNTTAVNSIEKENPSFYKIGGEPAEMVQIYVERVAAKVALTTIGEVSDYPAYLADDTEVQLSFTPNTWGVQATSKESYLVKQNTAIAESADWMETGAANFRSYWATSWGYDVEEPVLLPSGDAAYKETLGETLLDYTTYGDLANTIAASGTTYASTAVDYVLENTFPASRLNTKDLPGANVVAKLGYNPWSAVTSIVLAGTYTVTYGDDYEGEKSFEEGADFYLLPKAKLDPVEQKFKIVQQILTEAQAVDAMLALASYITNEDNTALTADDVNLETYYAGEDKENPANSRYLQLNETAEGTYKINGVSGKTVEAVNEELLKIGPAKLYAGGKAFFYIPLKHYYAAETNAQYLPLDEVVEGNYGIVRNNWYSLSVNKITGLGTGVGGDDDIPVPDPEEDAYAIDAVLNVLQWHMRNQSVDL